MPAYQTQIPLAGLPITLVLVSTGEVVLVPSVRFKGIFDTPDGMSVKLFDDELLIYENDSNLETVYFWNAAYNLRDNPPLKRWLATLNLISPF